ncbi:MAG: proteasome accessory factor PafA2 family protein, partial [Myxococcota bacterium]
TFGSHESYWVEDRISVATRLALLPAWGLLWMLSLPVLAWLIVAPLALLLATLIIGLVLLGTGAVLSVLRPSAARRILGWVEAAMGRLESRPGDLVRRMNRLAAPLFPLLGLHSLLYSRFYFRAFRRNLTGFLVTRATFCGAGAIVFDGGPLLRIAQRPPFVRTLARIFPFGEERPIFELRDLFFRPWSALGTRRRLHLLIGDANLCEWAQALRVGTTALVLEAIEEGGERDWPVLRDPLEALDRLNRTPDLDLELELEDGERVTPLEIQRRYLRQVTRVLSKTGEPLTAWKGRVLRMWAETLDLLEQDREALADRVDWIAKSLLLEEEVPSAEDWEALRVAGARLVASDSASTGADRRLRELAYQLWRVDLRYHELGPRGGYRRLEAAGRVRRLSRPEDVRRARTEPPRDTRAWARGRAIKWAHAHAQSGGVAWHRARLAKFDWRWFTDPLDPKRREDDPPDDPSPLG